jgi:hypothetical protein
MNHSSGDESVGLVAAVLLVGIAVAVAAMAFDRMLIHEGVPRWDLMAISNGLTGLVAGALFWKARSMERARREFVRERLHTISEMNHHIRNALQVISFYCYREQDAQTLEMLRKAVNRIEWALKEVLPGELGMHEEGHQLPASGYQPGAAIDATSHDDRAERR